MKKRLISTLIAMAMLLGTMPVSISAAEDESNTEPDIQVVDTEEEAPEEEEETVPEEPAAEEPEAVEPEDSEIEEAEPSEEVSEGVVPANEAPGDTELDETEVIPVDDRTVVTADNFFEYFNDYGELLETTGDELTFKGDFSGLGIYSISIGKSVAITSDNAVFTDIRFYITSGEVSIDGIQIIDDHKDLNASAAIVIEGGEDISISNCSISYTKAPNDPGSCINAVNTGKLSLTGNTLKYTGDTDKDNYNNAIKITGSTDVTIKENTIEASIPSVDVKYSEPDYKPLILSVGIDLSDCTGVDLTGNNVTITSSGSDGYYPTSNGLIISSPSSYSGTGPQVTVKDNTISIEGTAYTYGVTIDAASYVFTGNKVTVTSEVYGGAFESWGGSVSETVSSNDFIVSSGEEAVGVYAFCYYNETAHNDANIIKNKIDLEAEDCKGIIKDSTINSEDKCYTIEGNTIKTKGAVLCGIDMVGAGTDSVVKDNEIDASGTDTGSMGIAVSIALVEGNKITTSGIGIVTNGISEIKNNSVETTDEYTIDLKGTASTVTGNYLVASSLRADDSVKNKDAGDVHGNYPGSIAGAVISGISTKTYTGKAITQKPVVKVGNTVLVSGTDYKVTYKNNTKVGTATVTITGIGKYSGSVSKKFTIKKATNPMKVKAKSPTVKYSKLKKSKQNLKASSLVKFTKKGMGKVTYTLSSAKKGSKSYKKYFTLSSSGKMSIKKGLGKGTYSVKIKIKAKGDSNYNSLSKTLTVKIKVK